MIGLITKTLKNEALEDSFVDMMNYVFLAYCNYQDSVEKNVSE